MTPAIWHVMLGLGFNPAGVGALAWQDADQLSGTLAGEFDGVLRPPLTLYGGWYDADNAVLVDVSAVRFSTVTFSDTSSTDAIGATRLGVDYRRYLPEADAGDGHVDLYGHVGAYGILPNAVDTSEAYTEEDQASANEAAGELRARVSGVGARVGLGAGYRIGGAASASGATGAASATLGIRGALVVHRAQGTLETGTIVTVIALPEAALTLEFRR